MVETATPSPFHFIGRVLTFRFSAEDIASTRVPHLAIGLLLTWIVGIGRYWDNPRVGILQHLGLGSVAYVFALSAFLWLLFLPLRPSGWTYRHVLTFVAAVSPPALLYAIPVEKFMSLSTAQMVNFWFLAGVASWRVALYVVFLIRYAKLSGLRLAAATLLPLNLIVFALTALNLERAVFEIMAGNHPTPGTPADGAYAVLILLSFISIYVTPIVVIAYLVAIYQSRKRRS